MDTESWSITETDVETAALLGRTGTELLGMAVQELHPTDEGDTYRQLYRDLAGHPSAVVSRLDDGRVPIVCQPDETEVPVEIGSTIVERDGAPLLRVVYRENPDDPIGDVEVDQYRAAVESSVNPIAAVDRSLCFTFANAAYCEPFDVDQETIPGTPIVSVLGPERFQAVEPYIDQALDGTVTQFETTRTFPSGESRTFEVTYSPVVHEDGTVSGIVGTFNDISKRKARERELERILNGMEDAVFLHEAEGPFEVVNKTAVERYGYSEAELLEMSPKVLDADIELEKHPVRTAALFEEGSIVFETIHETKSGEYVPVEISSSVISYDGREVILSIARDISKRKASERRFEVLFNNASDAIVHTRYQDTEPIVQSVNPAFTDMFGFDTADLSGRSLTEVFDSTTNAYEIQELNRRIARGERVRSEIQRETPEGTRDFLLRSIPIDPDQDEYYRIYTDITNRKDRERTLLRQRDELQTLNRLNGLILSLIQRLVESESRVVIEQTICDELFESPLYEFAWIGERHPDTAEITVRAMSDCGEADCDEHVSLPEQSPQSSGLATQALDTGEIQVMQNTDADPRFPDEHQPDVLAESRSMAAIPLSHEGTVYAVLVIYAPREYAFGGRELAGLETLGEIVEFAIRAIRNQRALTTDTIVELDFDVTDSAMPFVELAGDLACSISLDGSVFSSAESTLNLFLSVEGVDASIFLERAREEPAVERVTLITEAVEGVHRVEITLSEPVLKTLISRHNTVIDRIELDSGEGTYVFHVPLSEDIREVVMAITSAFPAVRFRAKQELESSLDQQTGLRSTIVEELTERQYAALKNALLAGYFEWPRESTAADVAETLGLSSSTFQYHLRGAQRTIVSNLFG